MFDGANIDIRNNKTKQIIKKINYLTFINAQMAKTIGKISKIEAKVSYFYFLNPKTKQNKSIKAKKPKNFNPLSLKFVILIHNEHNNKFLRHDNNVNYDVYPSFSSTKNRNISTFGVNNE